MNTSVCILHYHCPKTWTVNKTKTWQGNLRKRKEENGPFKYKFSLVICVCNIILCLFSPWFSDAHSKNMTAEHPDPVLVYAQT